MQLSSNSWASKLLKTMWIHFHPYLKCRTVSDCSSVFQVSAGMILSFSRQGKKLQVHQPSSSSSFNSGIPVSSCKENPSRQFSRKQPSFGSCLESKCFNDYHPEFLSAPRQPCLIAHSEFLLRTRCVISSQWRKQQTVHPVIQLESQ